LHKISIKRPQGKRGELVERHGYDVKFAYHVVRLLAEVEMILLEQDVDLQRNHEQLKAIRRGEWTGERLRQWRADKQGHLVRAYAESALTAIPDEPQIRALLLTRLAEHYGSLEGYVVNPDRAVEVLRTIQMDVSIRSLEIAHERLGLDRLPEPQTERIRLLHGSLINRDRRLAGIDAAAVVEVLEHLDPLRLSAFERAVFEFARPGTVVLTTPNREYNVRCENLGAAKLRHADHRSEWTRDEFRDRAEEVAGRHGYSVRLLAIGAVDEVLGSPTQLAVFPRGDGNPRR
jgi:hypothetical protein